MANGEGAEKKYPPGWMDRKLFKGVQPKGNDGVKYSTEQVIRMILDGYTHPLVVAQARRILKANGWPRDNLAITEAVFNWMRAEGFGWCPDPADCEFIAAAHYFMPGEDGEEPLMCGADCEEIGAVVLCCLLLAAGVTELALVLASYDRLTHMIGHIFAAVHDQNKWIGVDYSYDGPFGSLQKSEWEVLIALPSGKVICNAKQCLRGVYAPAPVAPGANGVAHVRLEGLPRHQPPNLPRVPPGTGVVVRGGLIRGLDRGFGRLPPRRRGQLGFGEEGLQDKEERAAVEGLGNLLEAQRTSLLGWEDKVKVAHAGLFATFGKLGIDPDNNPYWGPADDLATANALDASEYFRGVLEDIETGRRRWAFGEDGVALFEQLPEDKKVLNSKGQLVDVLVAPPDGGEDQAALGVAPAAAATPAAPIAVEVLVVAGIVAVGVSYFAIRASLEAVQSLAEAAEQVAINETWAECAKNGDADKCRKLAAAVGEAQAAVKREEARREEAKAKQKEWDYKTVALLAGLAALAAGGVALWYTGAGGAILASAKGFFSKKQAA